MSSLSLVFFWPHQYNYRILCKYTFKYTLFPEHKSYTFLENVDSLFFCLGNFLTRFLNFSGQWFRLYVHCLCTFLEVGVSNPFTFIFIITLCRVVILPTLIFWLLIVQTVSTPRWPCKYVVPSLLQWNVLSISKKHFNLHTKSLLGH